MHKKFYILNTVRIQYVSFSVPGPSDVRTGPMESFYYIPVQVVLRMTVYCQIVLFLFLFFLFRYTTGESGGQNGGMHLITQT